MPKFTTFEVVESATAVYKATIQDENGTAIASTDLSTLTFTLYNANDPAKAIINARSGTNILNVGPGTVHATSGLLTLTLTPADNVIVDSTRSSEKHAMEIVWTYSAGSKTGRQLVMLNVRNLTKT